MRWLRGWCLHTAMIIVVVAVARPALAGDAALQQAKQAAEAAPRAPVIAREAFLKNSDVRDISLSPDGRWLAYRRDTGQRLELWVRGIGNEPDRIRERRVIADSEGSQLFWSGNGATLWLPDAGGLNVFDLAAQTGRRIFRYDDSRQQAFWLVDRNAPDYAVLREKVPVDGQWRYRYLAINAAGRTHLIRETSAALQSVLLDADGTLRYASGYDGSAFDTVIWKYENGEERELMRCPLPQQCRPIAYSGNTVWALAHNGEDLMSLQRLDAGSAHWRTLHRAPRGISDAVSVLMEPNGRDWLGVAYRPGGVEWHGRTPEANAALAALQAALPGANLDISPSDDGQPWLVTATKSGWQYDRYFLFEPQDTEKLPRELFAAERRGALSPAELVGVQPVHWRGKDGTALHGYVYLPKGIPLSTAPIVAFIHGGPYGRASGEGDPGKQLMANRGYIVFEPNFRASTGYGVKYATGARGDFGRSGVLDDIISGLDFLIANGIGDRKRQAVVGHSFGGYASLLAVTHYPGRFRFAVPSAAPVDMAWTMQDVAIEGGSALSADGPPVEVLLPGYGVPFGEQAWHDRMQRESPLAHASRLRTPVYLWAGGKDDRVAVESLVRYVAEANPDFRPALLIDAEAGHSPRERLNREALAWLIEGAANEHFGGGVTPPSPALQAFLKKNLRRGAYRLRE